MSNRHTKCCRPLNIRLLTTLGVPEDQETGLTGVVERIPCGAADRPGQQPQPCADGCYASPSSEPAHRAPSAGADHADLPQLLATLEQLTIIADHHPGFTLIRGSADGMLRL